MLNVSFIINSGMCYLPYFKSYMPVLCHVFLQRVQELAAPVLIDVDLAALALHIEVVRDLYNSADLLDTAIYLALLTAYLWEQEMGYMTSATRVLERLLGWPHVLDLFTTVQAEDERQIMQALQQLKLFSSDPEQEDLWRAVEAGRMVLSSFSRPLSTGD